MVEKVFVAMLVSVLAALAGAAEPPAFSEKWATRATIEQVREGGFVIYMRHGSTDSSKPDRFPQVDLNDCSTQRPLTDEGRQVASDVGKAIRRARWPIAEILVSPLCRARESAELAFGSGFVVHPQLMYSGNMTDPEKQPVVATTRLLLAKPVPPASNRLIVAHAPNLMDVMGYFPKPEGTVVLFRPHGEAGFEYIASIAPKQWAELLK